MKLDLSKLQVSVFSPEPVGFMNPILRGVRLYYPPTGHIIEESEERSVHRNKHMAMRRMTLAVDGEITPSICKVKMWNGIVSWSVSPAAPPRSASTAPLVLAARELRWKMAYAHAWKLNQEDWVK
ncbi:BcepGomrgp55 [Burkholderia phage BcepGomr]|uniref:BcepGomrgp55 n=1 Tax=Burkholderia phage BcepGomr TaxID=437329 RepID=UPI0001503508|nr:BcepGomrgp55 [Burkholderia phage BcepGomr]ABP63626.1 BcepGomrgp55 [Burkholderia phage BcepGomr]